jgi:hypothetical protein
MNKTTAVINGVETTASSFAYDGCHKIYLLEQIDEVEEAKFGYNILPISSLKRAYEDSCALRFISSWSLAKKFSEQFEEADINLVCV